MTTMQWVSLLALGAAGFAALAWLLLRLRADVQSPAVLERLRELESELEASFTKANADMAARIEQVKGDLRLDLAERLAQGLTGVRETVERQLVEGRAEQTRRLDATVAALEQKFDGLRTATESRLDQLAEKQAGAARESRQELTQSLAALTTGVQGKFDQLSESQAHAARQARAELAAALAESMRGLEQRFATLEQRTSQSLETIRSKVDERLQALGDQVQAKLEKNIQEGFAHFQKVQEHLRAAEEQLRHVGAVGQSITELNNLLKLPHLRGSFGEAELGRLLADFLPAGSFEEQAVIVEGSRERVDAVVKFPRFRLPIDSKFNREQILPLFETADPAALEEARRQLVATIKQQARDIAEKYIRPDHGTTDLALMFLPSETVYFEVIRSAELTAALHKLKVFPVSPNTLAITLRAVAMSISQYEFARNVQDTLNQIRQAQDHFGRFQKKFEQVGKGLQNAQEAYQTATGHLNRYANRVVSLTGEPVPELPAAESGGAPEPIRTEP